MRSLSLIVVAWLGVFVFADRAVPALERQLEASRLDDIADLERPLLPEGTAVVVVGIDLPPPWDLTLITVQTGVLKTWHPPLLLPGGDTCPSEIVSGLKTAYPGIFFENEGYARDFSLVSDWNTSAWIHVLRTTMMGLIEHRFYSPRLGHFLTPDFRLPDIYDPSSFTEPYAYATANPLMFWDPDGLEVIYLGDGRVAVEARDVYGVIQTLYLPQEHWVKLITGEAAGFGNYSGETFQLIKGVPDLTTSNGQAEYKARANFILEHMFGAGTEITLSAGEVLKKIGDTEAVVATAIVGGGLVSHLATSEITAVRVITQTGILGTSSYAAYNGTVSAAHHYERAEYGKATLSGLEAVAGFLVLPIQVHRYTAKFPQYDRRP
ncbi:MAG: hypothetical protein KDC35_14140 [Acidobacteria bacterium]|nr:hypothetical protein [Acidobacteriota bacterium]